MSSSIQTSVSSTSVEILRKNGGGSLLPVDCNFCTSSTSMKTSHVCHVPTSLGTQVIEGNEDHYTYSTNNVNDNGNTTPIEIT
jgi:hypothetical protein